MKQNTFWPGIGIGIMVGLLIGFAVSYLYFSEGNPSQSQTFVSSETKDFLAKTTVGKDDAVKWIKIHKFRNQDLSNPRDRSATERDDPERIGGFRDSIDPTRYFTLPIQYIMDAFNTWNENAGFPARILPWRLNSGFKGLRIYPMIYPNHGSFPNRRRMNLLLVPINQDGTELPDYSNKSGDPESFIFSLPGPGTIYNEIGQCPPNCIPVGTLDRLSGQ